LSEGVVTQGYLLFPGEEGKKNGEQVAVPISATLDFGTMSSNIRINPAIPPATAQSSLQFNPIQLKNAFNNAMPNGKYKNMVVFLAIAIAAIFIALIIAISVAVTRGVKIEALDMQISDLEDAGNGSSK